ncbi:MAG TPA: glycosyltransferase, partial [Caldilineaceae bacterium]|nr:glycosyltransferase [Caldilineaceae bacterium]
MRVLFINNWFLPDLAGGAEVSLYHTCRGIQRAGVDCTLLSVITRGAEPVNEWYHLDHIPVHRVRYFTKPPLNQLMDLRVYRNVADELAAVKPDLVHIHNVSGASLAPFLACRHAGVPVVNTLHDLWLICPNNMRYQEDGSYCDPRRFPNGCGRCFRKYDYWAAVPQRRRIFQALTSHVRTFIAPSQALIDRHVEAGYPPERFRLAPYGLEEPEAVAPRHPVIQDLVRTASTQPTVVFAGGGSEHKGAHIVLAAIPTLLAQTEGLRIIVAGGGEERFLQAYQRFAPAVMTLGPVPFADMRALFGAADLSIVASVWHENSPVVIYENFQVGTPVTGSAFGGTSELIDEDQTGYLYEVGNAEALAATVKRHFQKAPWQRRQMRQQCLRTVRTRLGLDAHVATHLRIYHEVL